MFAKLFNCTEHGQILVKIDQNEDTEPEIRFFFEPEGLGVCSVAISFQEKENGWEKADNLFEVIDQEYAVKLVSNTLSQIPKIV